MLMINSAAQNSQLACENTFSSPIKMPNQVDHSMNDASEVIDQSDIFTESKVQAINANTPNRNSNFRSSDKDASSGGEDTPRFKK